MKFALPVNLLKSRPEAMELDAKETFVDLSAQNAYLRGFTLLLCLGLLGSSITIFWELRRRPQIIEIKEFPDTAYGDAPTVFVSTGMINLAQPPASGAGGGPQPAAAGAGIADPTASSMRQPNSKSQKTGRMHVSQSATTATPLTSAAAPATQPPDQSTPSPNLWTLLDRIKNDPQREIVDKTFKSGDLTLVFKEATPGGLLSFDITNSAVDPVFMPRIGATESQGKAFIEHRVLEQDVKSTGVLQVPGLGSCGKLHVTVEAANLSPIRITLEVPKW